MAIIYFFFTVLSKDPYTFCGKFPFNKHTSGETACASGSVNVAALGYLLRNFRLFYFTKHFFFLYFSGGGGGGI
jgi:hypothetical protein